MKAMILAAGKGERMLPLTRYCPKPLLNVGGIPLLEHWLRKLELLEEITHIIVNAAYLGEKIVAYIDARHSKIPITVSVEPQPLETGGALYYALPKLGDEPFLLINSDVFCDAPMATWISDAHKCLQRLPTGEAFFMMVNNPSHNGGGDFAVLNGGVLALRPESCVSDTANKTYTFSGISLIKPRLIAAYPKVRQTFALREVFNWAIARQSIYAEHYPGYWVDVGTPERLAQLEVDLKSRVNLLNY